MNDELPDYSNSHSKANDEESPTETLFRKNLTAQRISVSPNFLSKQQSQYQTNMMAGYSQQHQIPQQYQPPQKYQQPQQYYSSRNPVISQYQSEYHVSINQIQCLNAMPFQNIKLMFLHIQCLIIHLIKWLCLQNRSSRFQVNH